MYIVSPLIIIYVIVVVAGAAPPEAAALLSISKRTMAVVSSSYQSSTEQLIDIRTIPSMLARDGRVRRRLGAPGVEECLAQTTSVDTMNHIGIQAVLTESCGATASQICDYAKSAGDVLGLDVVCEPNFTVTLENTEPGKIEGSAKGTIDGADDTYAYLQTGLIEMEVAEAWKLVEESGKRSTTDEIIIAVFDSGVDDEHEDLRDVMWTGPDGDHGYNFVENSNDVSDPLGHGTHCAGTIAAHRNNGRGITGITDAKLMSLNICDGSGSCNVLLVFRAFDYALEHGAQISSHSYMADTGATLLEQAYKNAGATGHVMIFAAGNENQEIGTTKYPCTLSRLISTSICVTHVDLDAPDKYMLAKKANYGPYVDMAAPGIGVLSTLPNSEYGYMSGSSMAAPHVTGVAGLLLSIGVNGEDIIRVLRASALPLSEKNTKYLVTGGGFLNARKSVENALVLLGGGQVTTQPWESQTTAVPKSQAPGMNSSTLPSPTRTVPSGSHSLSIAVWFTALSITLNFFLM
ncbi:Suppressor of the cold-sensitive snRNP bioproteinsis mutant brr1-1 [Perkinsus chesapeaki]|uniref:subtilisin n=1 Tax=Perkinsus chesapeaki TaxID=330153 RepID=A0A7J6N448_PERCH|nr:Suppressor of the cold-sensitive snRNP bioproteinsis mutant brr1-1 [Perkinsus chesapeaki]